MSRHGKMSGSPFHVENQFYKYAVEHENDGFRLATTPIECTYFSAKTKRCSLPHSGFQSCASHKCKYYRPELRRAASCEKCAYFYEDVCYHQNGNSNTDPSVASYCCFFVGEDKDHQFLIIKKSVKRSAICKEIEKCQASINRHVQYITKANKEIKSPTFKEKERTYLENKIKVRLQDIEEKKGKIASLRKELSDLS